MMTRTNKFFVGLATVCIAVAAGSLYMQEFDTHFGKRLRQVVKKDFADGRALYSKHLCMSCHGPSGREPAIESYPKIRGQSVDYTIAQILAIQSGKRNNNN